MFNLEESIKNWRKKVQATGGFEDGDVEELESHLRDRVDDLITKGISLEDAFRKAIEETGSPVLISLQNKLARERHAWQVSRTFLPALLVNYLKIMSRQFNKHRTHTWITVAGLSIGLTCCLFIAYYVLHELSYDKAYRGRQIYRVINQTTSFDGVHSIDAGGPVPMGVALREEFPEVKNAVRFWRAYLPIIRYGDAIFEEKKFVFADSGVFDVFDFQLLVGNPSRVYSLPNSVVISEEMSNKYFKGEDPIGKVVEYNGYPAGKLSFVVTGVFKNLPENTHFSFDFLASFQAMKEQEVNWGSFKPVWTYVELNDEKSADQLQAKLSAFANKYVGDRVKENKEFSFVLEKVSDIHLRSKAARPMKPGGSMSLIQIIMMTGVMILVMSCVNFINTSLAKAMVRMKEVGVRKVLGAAHQQLLFQFITEVIMAFFISMLIALGLVALLSPQFENLTGVRFHGHLMLQWQFMVAVLGIFVFVILLSGYYPARVLSSYGILQGLRQNAFKSVGKNSFNYRNALIFLQFSISAMLIMCALIVKDQLEFIENKDLGVKLDRVIAVPFSRNPQVFEDRLHTIKGIESFASSQRLPVNTLNYDGRIVEIPGRADVVHVQSCFVTPEFLETYGIQLIAGRNLNSLMVSDSNKFIINETAMKRCGWNLDNAVGQPMNWSRSFKGEVIGVVRDFHLESVHASIEPLVMLNAGYSSWQRTFTSIRFNADNAKQVLEAVEKTWKELNPEGAFYFVNMEESFKQLHTNDINFARLIFYFTIVAIFISGIGLYAISSYAAERKRKEIGIRKVLGSDMANIVYKLAAPFLLITLSSLIIAIPLVLWLMRSWLNTFAYATSIAWQTLLTGVLCVVILTLISILKESLRAAMINPVKFLREE